MTYLSPPRYLTRRKLPGQFIHLPPLEVLNCRVLAERDIPRLKVVPDVIKENEDEVLSTPGCCGSLGRDD